MDQDQRETANRLFVHATAALEDATEVAIAGQSARLSVRCCRMAAHRLQAVACDIADLAAAVLVVAGDADQPKKR
jgi:hypothetical protein